MGKNNQLQFVEVEVAEEGTYRPKLISCASISMVECSAAGTCIISFKNGKSLFTQSRYEIIANALLPWNTNEETGELIPPYIR